MWKTGSPITSDAPTLGSLICDGIVRCIWCLRLVSGREPAIDFLDGLHPRRRKAKLAYRFQELADNAQVRNKQKFKRVEGSQGLFEFKSDQARVACFFASDGDVILIDGCIKKAEKLPREFVNRCQRLMHDFQWATSAANRQLMH